MSTTGNQFCCENAEQYIVLYIIYENKLILCINKDEKVILNIESTLDT